MEKELAEVTAGNMHELPDGTKKWKPEFEKLSKDGGYPALKEEACEENDAVAAEKRSPPLPFSSHSNIFLWIRCRWQKPHALALFCPIFTALNLT